MGIIDERVNALRKVMKDNNIDVYYIPTSDYHDSEYVSPFFKVRAYMSGFTGSAGLMVVTSEKAVVWSDGRYFIQAEKQLEGTCIDFYHMNDPEYDTVEEFIVKEVPENGTLGFDGKVVSYTFGETVEQLIQSKNVKITYDLDLVDQVWKDRPSLPMDEAYLLDIKYTGKSTKDKINDILNEMKKEHATKHVISTLDDIAWILNIRGNDVDHTPVILSYLVISEDSVTFYVNQNKINKEVRKYLEDNKVIIKDYDAIYEDVKDFDETVLVDTSRANYALVSNMCKAHIISKAAPSNMMKACKNEVELQNLRECHVRDGVAVTKFMYWLKTNINKMEISEISASDYLQSLREQIEDYIDLSFDTISAYNANAAMMHYRALPENHALLKPEGLLLVDSGGQYYSGTTDITRTFALGPVDDEWKKDFSSVLTSHANMAQACFLKGCSGINLDILARQPIWERNLDYQCGTGHGVGYLLGVHEGPHGLRYYQALNRKESTPFEKGMVVTNEPGIYIEGSHGIRIENELITHEGVKNQYGQFMYFETMTFVPIDIDMIDIESLDERTKKWLNAYHKQVFEKISPFLNDEEKEWLKKYTREI